MISRMEIHIIWMDEKGFGIGSIQEGKVICSKENLDPRIKEPSNTEWASLLECISNDGFLLPPFFILKGKIQMEAWLQELQKGGKICLSDKGWTNNSLGLQWFKDVFQPVTKQRQKGAWRLLILDGHSSHITTEVITFCKENSIVLACLPPHTTAVLQPLDVSFFLPLATEYRRSLVNIFTLTKASAVTKTDFIKIYQQARTKIGTPKNILRAWQKSGLFPFNPQIAYAKIPKWLTTEAIVEQRPITPPEVLVRTEDSIEICAPIQTPRTIEGVKRIIEKIRAGTANPLEYEKLGKACQYAFTKVGAINALNDKIVTQNEAAEQGSKTS